MKKTCLMVIILLTIAGTVIGAANKGDIRFERISIAQGLSLNMVNCILQDSKGFMWFGTLDGLNKYDGYNFAVYQPAPEIPDCFGNYNVIALCEDDSGMIWIGTVDRGLYRYAPQKDRLYRYTPSDGIEGRVIKTIYQDSSGTLWVSTERNGLFIRRPTTPGEKERFMPYGNDSNDLTGKIVTTIVEGPHGTLWLGTFEDGLKKLNLKTGDITHYRSDPNDPESLGYNSVSCLHQDRSGTLWVGTYGGGLNRLDSESGKFRSYIHDPKKPGTMGINRVRAIEEDRQGALWLGTNAGIIRFEKDTGSFSRYLYDDRAPGYLTGNQVNAIYEDRGGVLWIGTDEEGLKIVARMDKFEHYMTDPENPNSLGDNMLHAIHEDRSGTLWIGTANFGLDALDRKTGTWTHYRKPGEGHLRAGFLSDNQITAICEDHTGALWIGTLDGGLNRLNRDKKTFTVYRNNAENPGSLSSDQIIALCEDSTGTLWIGTLDRGLNRLNRDTDTFTYFRHDPKNPNSLSRDNIHIIYESPSQPGILWIGTGGGLNRFDPQRQNFERFLANPEDPDSLSSNVIPSICEDRSGTLWVGTYAQGLNQLVRTEGNGHRFIRYTEKNGLCNNTIYAILEDQDGYLWMSTNRGLSRLDPKTGTFKNYNPRDGLQDYEFNSGAFYKSKSGEMFFGGINGFNAFHPSRIKENPHVPPVVITGFNLYNKPVPIGGDSPLKTAVPWAKELILPYHQNVFSFQFAAMDFRIPKNNCFAFKMEGFDKDWVRTDAHRRYASYTNLDPGKYVFRVRGSNNDGVWNNEGTSITIIITPPYWQTWWFRLLLVLLLAAVLFGFHRMRMRNLTLKLKTDVEQGRIFDDYKISPREREIIRLILKGKSNKDIEDTLFISLPTVKIHIYNVYKKMNVKNRLELIRLIQKSVNIN